MKGEQARIKILQHGRISLSGISKSSPRSAISDRPMIKAVLHPIEVVKVEQIICGRRQRRDGDGRRQHCGAPKRLLGRKAISCAIAQGAEPPGSNSTQIPSRQERKSQPAILDKAADRNRRRGGSEGEHQHDRKGQHFPQKPNRLSDCAMTCRSHHSQHTNNIANSVPRDGLTIDSYPQPELSFDRLPDADVSGTIVCMRTTLNLDDELLDAALEATGEAEKTKVIHLGLEALIQQKAAERLAALSRTAPKASAAPRRREWQRRRK